MAQNKLRPLVICGPSGSGKSTLLNKLLADYPNKFGFSVSHTTRKPRENEKHGVHYYYTTVDEMEKMINDGKFLEHARFSGNMYGTSKAAVESVQKQGKVCVLDIDVQGVKQIQKTNLDPYYVFISPPSIDALEKRLRQRKTETEASLKKRLGVASKEMEYGELEGNFDLVIINDKLEDAYKQLKEFVEQKVLKDTPIENS